MTAPTNNALTNTTSNPHADPHAALLVMVHGSPRPESNGTMYEVVEEVRARGPFGIVQVGFMECNEPDIPTAIEGCVNAGATRVVAVPYFLHAGNHVADDLPGLLEDAKGTYPHVEFLMGDYLGRDEAVVDALAERAQEAV